MINAIERWPTGTERFATAVVARDSLHFSLGLQVYSIQDIDMGDRVFCIVSILVGVRRTTDHC